MELWTPPPCLPAVSCYFKPSVICSENHDKSSQTASGDIFFVVVCFHKVVNHGCEVCLAERSASNLNGFHVQLRPRSASFWVFYVLYLLKTGICLKKIFAGKISSIFFSKKWQLKKQHIWMKAVYPTFAMNAKSEKLKGKFLTELTPSKHLSR